jgi:hypothetical protein
VINPGIIASSRSNTGGASTAAGAGITPNSAPADYITLYGTSATSQVMYNSGVTPETPIVISWAPSTTTGLTGYIIKVTYTNSNGQTTTDTLSAAATATNISYTPAMISISSYAVSVTATTSGGATGQTLNQTITATLLGQTGGSSESSGTSAAIAASANAPGTNNSAFDATEAALALYNAQHGVKGSL